MQASRLLFFYIRFEEKNTFFYLLHEQVDQVCRNKTTALGLTTKRCKKSSQAFVKTDSGYFPGLGSYQNFALLFHQLSLKMHVNMPRKQICILNFSFNLNSEIDMFSHCSWNIMSHWSELQITAIKIFVLQNLQFTK